VKNKQTRLENIKAIIRENKVRNQETLSALLKNQGIEVTQATLSRDLKQLKVGKIYEVSSGYYYVLQDEAEANHYLSFMQDFRRGFLSVDFSKNIAVIRTITSHAETVGMALDNLKLDEVLGSVAGEDTVFVVLKEGVTGEDFLKSLRKKVPNLEKE
jgi:transcriptional regulator of arginine metabolism